MARKRTSAQHREREFKKRERQQKKREKAARKREDRQDRKNGILPASSGDDYDTDASDEPTEGPVEGQEGAG